MSPETTTTLLNLDDDPLGSALLEFPVTFGVQAATLAGNPPDSTSPDDWREALFSWSCSITFTPQEPDPT